MTPDSNPTAQGRKIAFVCISIVVIGVILYMAISEHRKMTPATPSTAVTDQPTQPAGKQPVTPPVYTGVSDLIDRGLLSDQVEAIKMALAKYALSQNKTVKAVAFSNVQHYINKTPAGDTIHSYGFDVALDGTAYTTKVSLASDTAVRLYVYDAKDPAKLLYDSNVVDVKTQH
jgi:hypothetical protein